MPLETVEHRRLYRQVADQLRMLIEEGEYPPGARLPPERELAEKLGISRPTVREALIALEVEGKVRIRVGSGIYVAEGPHGTALAAQMLQGEGPFEVLQARQLIEMTIAGEAALQATAEDFAALSRILDAMAEPDQPNRDYIRLDREFHVSIAGILGNGFLARVVGELYDQRVNPFFTRLASHFESSASWAQARAEHQLIYERLAARDGPGAAKAMRDHLQASQDRFSESFGEAAALPKRRTGKTGKGAKSASE